MCKICACDPKSAEPHVHIDLHIKTSLLSRGTFLWFHLFSNSFDAFQIAGFAAKTFLTPTLLFKPHKKN